MQKEESEISWPRWVTAGAFCPLWEPFKNGHAGRGVLTDPTHRRNARRLAPRARLAESGAGRRKCADVWLPTSAPGVGFMGGRDTRFRVPTSGCLGRVSLFLTYKQGW